MPAKITIIHASEYFSDIRLGEFVYPGQVKNDLQTSMVNAYKLCDEGVEEGVLARVLAVYCPHCNAPTGLRYESVQNIPEKIICQMCEKTISDIITENNVVIYQKI